MKQKLTQEDIELLKAHGDLEELYGELVTNYIRERYTLDSELAILRQRDTKPEEFAEYDRYAEACKTRAKEEIYG